MTIVVTGSFLHTTRIGESCSDRRSSVFLGGMETRKIRGNFLWRHDNDGICVIQGGVTCYSKSIGGKKKWRSEVSMWF